MTARPLVLVQFLQLTPRERELHEYEEVEDGFSYLMNELNAHHVGGYLREVTPEQAALLPAGPVLLEACESASEYLDDIPEASEVALQLREALALTGRALAHMEGCPALVAPRDARLMLAAPKLLEACKQVSEWLDLLKQNYPDMSGLIRGAQDAKAAVAMVEE